jgi:hypothetical protein
MKLNLIIDKASAFALIGVVAAMCGFIMLKNGIEKLIHGRNTPDEIYARTKGTTLIVIALLLIAGGIAAIVGNKLIIDFLASQSKMLITTV